LGESPAAWQHQAHTTPVSATFPPTDMSKWPVMSRKLTPMPRMMTYQ